MCPWKSKKEGKDQESIQSSTTPDPGYGLESDNFTIRVGSHVVSVRIHCTEKWRTSFHTDVLSKSK